MLDFDTIMITIGITGGIGSGKSTVGAMLKELGAAFIDADKVGHRLLREDTQLKQAILQLFGDQILAVEGNIDRRRLAAVVFNDSAALSKLNSISHPAISGAVGEEIRSLRTQGYGVAVVEAPLLVEAGWTKQTDIIWLTIAPPEVVLKRLVEKMGYTEAEAQARIHSQTSNEERIRFASAVINTDTSLEELRAKVKEMWLNLKA